MKHRTIAVSLFLTVLIAFLASGCQTPPSKEPISKSGMFFDTIISIKIYDKKDTGLLERCFELCRDYENKFSRTIPTSEISKINNASGKPVQVSQETADLIAKGLYYSELSGGAFDITLAPVSDLWNFQEHTGEVPPDDKIKEALQHVNYQNVTISGNTVTVKDIEASIDLGGIAKGYIADQLKDYLEKEGVEHALISLGGNVLAIGGKPDGSDFQIGIQKPFDKQNTAITTVGIHGQSVVSSGVYERYFKKDGVIYHHILDPRTGYPYQNGLLGVTIISGQSADCDGLSTACFALGLEKGTALIESLENTKAIFITEDYKLHQTNS